MCILSPGRFRKGQQGDAMNKQINKKTYNYKIQFSGVRAKQDLSHRIQHTFKKIWLRWEQTETQVKNMMWFLRVKSKLLYCPWQPYTVSPRPIIAHWKCDKKCQLNSVCFWAGAQLNVPAAQFLSGSPILIVSDRRISSPPLIYKWCQKLENNVLLVRFI